MFQEGDREFGRVVGAIQLDPALEEGVGLGAVAQEVTRECRGSVTVAVHGWLLKLCQRPVAVMAKSHSGILPEVAGHRVLEEEAFVHASDLAFNVFSVGGHDAEDLAHEVARSGWDG